MKATPRALAAAAVLTLSLGALTGCDRKSPPTPPAPTTTAAVARAGASIAVTVIMIVMPPGRD